MTLDSMIDRVCIVSALRACTTHRQEVVCKFLESNKQTVRTIGCLFDCLQAINVFIDL